MRPARLGVPWLLVAALVALGGIVAIASGVKVGGSLMASGLLLAGVMRAVLPERHVLDIKVRSRSVDIVLYVGAAIMTFVAFGAVRVG